MDAIKHHMNIEQLSNEQIDEQIAEILDEWCIYGGGVWAGQPPPAHAVPRGTTGSVLWIRKFSTDLNLAVKLPQPRGYSLMLTIGAFAGVCYKDGTLAIEERIELYHNVWYVDANPARAMCLAFLNARKHFKGEWVKP